LIHLSKPLLSPNNGLLPINRRTRIEILMPDIALQSSGARPVPSQDSNRKHRSVFYGWWVVLAAAVGLFWGAPITVFSFSVFLKPLMHDFHAGRGQISLGYTLGAIAGAVSAPTIGWLMDRYGARKVILPATAMFGAVLLLARTLSPSIWHFYIFYVSLGLLVHGAGPVPYGSVISHWFDRRRGLALGLMMFGIGSGAMVMPSLAQHLITRLWLAQLVCDSRFRCPAYLDTDSHGVS